MAGFFFMIASGLVWMGLSVDLDLEMIPDLVPLGL